MTATETRATSEDQNTVFVPLHSDALLELQTPSINKNQKVDFDDIHNIHTGMYILADSGQRCSVDQIAYSN